MPRRVGPARYALARLAAAEQAASRACASPLGRELERLARAAAGPGHRGSGSAFLSCRRSARTCADGGARLGDGVRRLGDPSPPEFAAVPHPEPQTEQHQD